MTGPDVLLAEIGRAASPPFEEARALPAEAYTDPALAALEVERLFRADWIRVGRVDEIPEPGGYVAHRIAGTPVAAVRQRDGSIRAFVNVCRHRAAELLSGVCRTARIVCPHHAWAYGLDGALRTTPYMGGRRDTSGLRLEELGTDLWEGWIYVTLDRVVAPISERLASLSERIAAYRMADHVSIWRANEAWSCDWKTLAENFTESCHLFSSHKDTLEPFTPTRGVWCEPGDEGWNVHWRDTSRPQGRTWPDVAEDARARFPLAHVFPSHAVSVSLDRGFWMSLQPDGPGRVDVLWGVTLPRPLWPDAGPEREALRSQAVETFGRVNREDRAIVESVARSLAGGRAPPGPLGEKERTIREFQRFLARALGAPVPTDGGTTAP